MSKSNVNLKGIFANPPNTRLKSKNFEGELVLENRELERTSEFVLKLQGHRRYKMSCSPPDLLEYRVVIPSKELTRPPWGRNEDCRRTN